MHDTDTARTMLRTATAAHHDRVDAVFSRADLTDRDGYGRFMLAQAAAHLPVERALTAAGAADVLADWAERRRAPLILADLAALGLTPPDSLDSDVTLTFDTPTGILGGIYVLEGSRLGGTLLKRSVPQGFPTAFLGAGDSAMWRRLLAALDAQLDSDAKRQDAVAAAARVFDNFERAGMAYFADPLARGDPVRATISLST